MRDYPHMQKNYARARELMARNGNPTQWGDTFPKDDVVRDDIAQRRAMLLVDEVGGHERILAQFALCPGEDPTYHHIDGAWLDDDSYVTIHRIASSGLISMPPATASPAKHYGNVRADTHPNNKAMQHVLETSGFARCGLIQLLDRLPIRQGSHTSVTSGNARHETTARRLRCSSVAERAPAGGSCRAQRDRGWSDALLAVKTTPVASRQPLPAGARYSASDAFSLERLRL